MKTSIKRFSKRTISIVLAVMMLVTTLTIGVVSTNAAYTDSDSVGGQSNLHWQGKIYFRAPDTWDIDTYSKVQIDITRTTSDSNSNYQYYATTMSRIGNSRLFYATIDADHGIWGQSEYVAFTANSSTYDSVTFALNGNHYYTKPLDYGFNDSSKYYFINPKDETSNSTTTNYNEVTANYYSTLSAFQNAVKAQQTVQIYTDGTSSGNGGNVSLTSSWPSGEGTSLITESTANSSSASSVKYDGAVQGTKTTLTATPNTGYNFDGWYDADDNLISSDTTYTYYVYNTKTLNAKFSNSETLYDVAVNSNDESMGTVSPASVQAGETTNPEITATPKEGYDFTGWTTTGGVTVADETSATTTVSATAAGTVTANFVAKQTYAITVASAANGSVTADKASAYSGQTVTLTVSPSDGYKLESLAVKDANGDDVTATASSDKTTYTFTMPASAVTVTPTFVEKTTVTLYLKNSANWSKVFVYLWTGRTNNSWPGVEITSNKKPINGVEYYYYELPDDINYTNVIFDAGQGQAQTESLTISGHTDTYYYDNSETDASGWKAFPYALSIASGDNGTVKYDNKTDVAAGSSQTVYIDKDAANSIVATPNTGYKFTGWTVTGDATVADATSASTTVTATADGATVTANFEIVDYTLTKCDTTGGSFTLSKETANYNDEITVTCTPNKGYKVTQVTYTAGSETSNATLTDNTATFTMPASDVTVNVKFAPEDYAISTSVVGSGSLSVKKEGAADGQSITQYNIGDKLVIKADPATGYELENVIITFDDSTTDTHTEAQFTLDMADKTGAISIEATFSLITYTGLSGEAEYSTNGTTYDLPLQDVVTIDATQGTYTEGVAIHAANKDGYQFIRWDIKADNTGYVDNATAQDTTFYPSADNTGVIARYKRLYTVSTTTSGTGLGTVTVEKTTPQLAGETTKITVAANSDSTFSQLLVNGKAVTVSNNTYTLTYNGTNDGDNNGVIDVEAVFKSNYYVKGETGLTGIDWGESDDNNAKANGDGSYTVVFKGIAAGTYNFKPYDSSAGTWYDYDYFTTKNQTGCTLASVGDNKNIGVTLTEESDVTITFNPTAKTLSVSAITTDPTEYTITLNDQDSTGKTAPATVSATASRRGQTISVTTSPAAGYNVSVVVTNDTTSEEITLTDGQFVMPGANVTVTVTYTEKPKYNVTIIAGQNGTSYFIYNGTTYTIEAGNTQTFMVVQGDTIALNAEAASDYVFEKWYRSTDSTYYHDASVVDQKITADVTYSSSFKEETGEATGLYMVYGTKQNPTEWEFSTPVYKKNGQAVAYLPSDKVSNGKKYYFAISGSTSYSSMYYQSTNDLSVSTDTEYKKYITAEKNDYGNYRFGYLSINSSKVTAIKFDLGHLGNKTYVSDKTYKVIPTVKTTSSTGVDIYAKDGTIRSGYQKYADMADTKFVSGHTTAVTSHTYYEESSSEVGNTVVIKTTIAEEYRSKYYVRGFAVNGQTYSVNTSANASGVYTLTLPITEDMAGKTLEVTPVYFYSSNDNMITFYVRGFSDAVAEKWGNTIAAHFWYNGGSDTVGSTDDNKNALGGYPGQPLLNEGGFYYVQVPKYLNGDTTKPVTGVTLNNYVWDDIHKTLVSGGTDNNCQTYDFKDFVRLSELTGTNAVDNIIFDFKYRTEVENKGLSTIPTSTDATVYKNGWEDLTDYYSRKVDIYGNLVTDDTLEPVYVVSKGYQSNVDGKVPSATYGAYATSWTVYTDGQQKLVENCAALINATEQDDSLKGHPTYITYESSIFGGDDKGDRCDGRWYYSRRGDRIKANVAIQYAETKNGTYVDDPFVSAESNIGTTTGTSVYFTDEDYYGKTSETALVNESNYFNFNVETDAYGDYTFLGWYQVDSSGEMTLFSTDQNAKAPMAGNATFIARFYKTPTGYLPISHKLYSTAPTVEGMPEVKGGMGECLAKVEVLDSNGNIIKTYDETAGTITVSDTYIKANSGYSLKITLTSKPAGVNTFWNTYVVSQSNTYDVVSASSAVGSTTAVTTVRTIDIAVMFNDAGELISKALNYYSDFVPVSKDYKITFNYTDRFGANQIYVIKGTLSESYITENGAVLSKDLVMKKAPYEDNFGETIKWNDASISYGETSDGVLTATVNSIQTGRKVYLNYQLTPDDPAEVLERNFGDLAVEKNDDGSYFTYDSGKYKYLVEAPESITVDNEEVKFSYWEIFTDAEHTDLVSRCYSRKFNYVLYTDYYIVPVFEGTKYLDESGTYSTIQLLEYSRNQWTDADGKKTSQTDKLYADFQLSFTKDGQILNSDEASDVQNCGILFEVGTKLDENLADAFKDNPESFTFETDLDALKQSIKDGKTKSDEGRNLLKTEIATSKLSNKNRIEFYKGFANSIYNSTTDKYTYTNALYLIKVYSYMIDTNGNVTLSDPVYINFYDVATMQYTVS